MTHKLNPQLLKRINLFSATMIVMGSIIGSGIFKKIAPMSLKLQSGLLILICWAIAGLITLLAALTYAEVAGRLAKTGGFYVYLREMYNDLVAFLFGWSCFAIIQTASIASIAYVFSESFLRIVPMNLGSHKTQIVAAAAIALLTLCNILGVLFAAWIENIFTVLKIAGIFVVVYFGFAHGQGSSENFQLTYDSSTPLLSGWKMIPLMFTAMLGAFWAYDGVHNLGYLGGEVKEGEKNIPRAFIIGVLSIIAIYLLVNISFLYAMPLSDIYAIAQKPDSLFAIDMTQNLGGASWALFVAILIAVSTFGATNGSILASSRIYYAMARDGLFFKKFGHIHAQYHTPIYALLFQATWACALVFIGSFDELTDMLIFAAFIFNALGAYGLFILRRKKIGTPPFLAPTWIPISYAVFCLVLVGVNIIQYPKQASIGLALILSGLPIYFWLKKSKA